MISIVVPVYNVEKYVKKCIDSILKQTYSDYELILVNDGSLDSSGEICSYYANSDCRIKVIHKKNGGLSDARNTGIQQAKGDWITFIDSDDYVSEDYLETLYNLIVYNNADISIASFTVVSKFKNADFSDGSKSIMNSEETIRRMLLGEGFDMGAWGKMYRTSFFKNNLYPVGKLFEDSKTTYQIISQANKIAFYSKSIYYYMNRKESIVNSKFSENKLDLIEMNLLSREFILKKYPRLTNETNRRVLWAYFSTLNQVIQSNDSKIIEKYSPSLVEYILSQEVLVKSYKEIPRRDKFAFYILKYMGLKWYQIIWYGYLKVKKGLV